MADPVLGGANRPTDALQYERRIADNDAQVKRNEQFSKIRQQQTQDAREASAERTAETQRQAANNGRGQYVDIRA